MGKIFTAPQGIKKPEFKPRQDWNEFNALETAYENQIIEWAKKNGQGPEAGQVVQFPVADGYARYVILSLKPVKLIHIDTGDAWHFQFANRLTAADLRKQLASAKAMRALFAKNEEKKEACIDKIIAQTNA